MILAPYRMSCDDLYHHAKANNHQAQAARAPVDS